MATIESLKKIVRQFCEERDWDQFHNPKDLAIGISTEANELLELFRFKSESEIKELLTTGKFKERMGEEVADVLFFILRIAQMNQIDLATVLTRKISKNAEKYPVATAKGSNKKYNE